MKRLLGEARKMSTVRALLIAAVVMTPLVSGLYPSSSQTGTPPQRKEGKTAPVVIIPDVTSNAGEVVFKPDTDHDGMPDEEEEKNGTDPADPSDADGDADGDGLTNGDEVAGGSQVNNADSDGDGVSDGEEASLGYNPTSGASTPPPSVVSIEAGPRTLALSINTLFGPRPAQLTVTGRLSNGATADLTTQPGTTYESRNLSVAVVDAFGTVVGVAPGSTTVVARRGALSSEVSVNVINFTPSALSSVAISGYANNVKVNGDYAYVAAGAAGVQVVDIKDKRAPRVVGGLDTSGNADDIRIVGNLAYVADGPGGLKVMSLANPATPALVGALALGGDSMDVFVQGTRAYVAGGEAGLSVVDVTNPAAPALLGTLDTPQLAHGVSVSGAIAVVADDSFSTPSVVIVDVSDPQNPRALATQQIASFNGGAKDVEARDGLAYVAGYDAGFFIVDFSNPAAPSVVGSLLTFQTGGFASRYVTLDGDYAVFAEQMFSNAVPFVLISDPARPRYRGVIDFSPLADYAGTGIAVDGQFVYMTGERFIVNPENGASGDTRLFIGQHDSLVDNNGVAPTVTLDSPAAGRSVTEAAFIQLSATAADDVGVASVRFVINGAEYGPRFNAPPYKLDYMAPVGSTGFTVAAVADDFGGNRTTTPAVTVNVTPDPPPSVSLNSPAAGTVLVNGETAVFKAVAADNVRVARVLFSVNGEQVADDAFAPFEANYLVPEGVTQVVASVTAVDNLGKTATASRTFAVVLDPLTTVTGAVTGGAGAGVTALGRAAQASAGGLFQLDAVPTLRRQVKARAMLNIGGRVYSGASQRVEPVRGGTTNVGSFGLAPVGRILFHESYTDDAGAFQQDIFTANLDGTDRVRLTPEDGWQFNPLVSPDGRQVLYQSFRECQVLLMLMNADGSNRRTVETDAYDFTWSPDSAQIAYSKFEQIWNGSAWETRQNIFTIDRALQTAKRQLTSNNNIRKNDLRWSPDGTRILFVGATEGGPYNGYSYDLYTVRVTTLSQSRLTFNQAPKWEPNYAPNGATVSFVQSDDDDSDNVYLVGPTSSNLRRLTAGGWWYYDTAWSANGAKIAVTRELSTGNGSAIVLLDPATGAGEVLTTDEIYNWQPRWSEDGTQLAFLSDDGMQVVEADGMGQRVVNDTNASYGFTWLKAAAPAADPLTTVRGRVIDSADAPVAGARVRVGEQFTATTAADGTFVVTGVPTRDGKVTAFASAASPQRVMSGASASLTPVAGGNTQAGDIKVSEKIVFLTGRDGNWEVYSCDADGKNERRLTSNTYDEFRPSLSPDKTRVAFSSNRSGQHHLHVMNIDGSSPRQLGFTCDGTFDPKWSPDGTKILFTGRRDGNADVAAINADGSGGVTYLTDSPYDDFVPDWSPDGARVVFATYRDGGAAELYVMNADGTDQTRLTFNTSEDAEPAWSPDGTKIAYNTNRNGVDDIYVMNVDGTNDTRLTTATETGYYASWSHDGTRILFSSTRQNGWQLWTINADGSNPVRITVNNIGSDFQPDW